MSSPKSARLLTMAVGATLLASCAAAMPPPISAQQTRTFLETVQLAERESAPGENPAVDAALREAKADFYYAEHSPMNPERARSMAVQAQAEADLAVSLSRGRAGGRTPPVGLATTHPAPEGDGI